MPVSARWGCLCSGHGRRLTQWETHWDEACHACCVECACANNRYDCQRCEAWQYGPLHELLVAVATRGRPSLAWVVAHSSEGAEPLQSAWSQPNDTHSMLRLLAMLEQLYAQVTHFRNLTLRLPGRAAVSAAGLAEILRAIQARDADSAEALMRGHIDDARHALLRHMDEIENQPEEAT